MTSEIRGAPTLIDCDPGLDDAVALLLAMELPELDVVGVTAVSGNLPSSATYENALRVLGFAGCAGLPVGRGPLNPLVRQLAFDPFSHGPGGLGGRELPIPPRTTDVPYAPDLICDLAQAYTGELVLICLGPLTNLALALRRDPDLPTKIHRVVVLGGSFGFGQHAWRNGTGANPVSEWNVYVDPEAASLVFSAGFSLTAVGLDASTDPAINLQPGQLEHLRAGREPGRFCVDMVDFVLSRGFESYCALIDSVAVAVAAHPDLVQTQHVPCVVETRGEATLGMTVVDSRHHHVWNQIPRIHVASSLDCERFHRLLLTHLSLSNELVDPDEMPSSDTRLIPTPNLHRLPWRPHPQGAPVTAEPTTQDIITAHRERIWAELAVVGKPDSRFHWDFSSFIADFDGSDRCAERVRQLDAYQANVPIFITPDNSTEALRRQAMTDGKTILMTTYGIRRGFLQLDSTTVPAQDRRYAATLDGMDTFARPVSIAELRDGPTIKLLVTGGSAVSANGVRFGKGHGYFDLEWAMLSEIGRVDETSQVADVVHDCQFVHETLQGEDHDVPVDWIVTPTEAVRVLDPGRSLGYVRWNLLVDTELEFLPPIEELRAARTAQARP